MRISALIAKGIPGRNKNEFDILENNRKDHFHLDEEMKAETRSKNVTEWKIEQALPFSISSTSALKQSISVSYEIIKYLN